MGLDVRLHNTDESSKHIVMYDKVNQVTPKITLNATRSNHSLYVSLLLQRPKFKSVLLQAQLFLC